MVVQPAQDEAPWPGHEAMTMEKITVSTIETVHADADDLPVEP